jgi:arylamine N-acetyltransferase
MTILDILIYFALVGILLALYLMLFTWHFWPALLRKSHCAWCWKSFHLMRWYPQRWSSTICLHHDRQLRAQSAARRERRLAEERLPGEVRA